MWYKGGEETEDGKRPLGLSSQERFGNDNPAEPSKKGWVMSSSGKDLTSYEHKPSSIMARSFMSPEELETMVAEEARLARDFPETGPIRRRQGWIGRCMMMYKSSSIWPPSH